MFEKENNSGKKSSLQTQNVIKEQRMSTWTNSTKLMMKKIQNAKKLTAKIYQRRRAQWHEKGVSMF